MNILIAPDKFRGSLEAAEVCDAVEKGVLMACPSAHVIKTPLADGGEGTAAILTKSQNGKLIEIPAQDPLGREIRAVYGISGNGKTAFIEMSAASGLQLLKKEEQNPLFTSTYGTGEMIAHALEKGADTIILGIGGSATTDAGTGMARALGFRFLDEAGSEVMPNGKHLRLIKRIDDSGKHPLLAQCKVVVACDVTNPLYGPDGAACVYGPQKGADEAAVLLLDEGLRSFAQVASAHFGNSLENIPGAGAAGGVGAGAVWFLEARLHEGIRIVMEQLEIPAKVKEMDLVITGEGKADEQTLSGKVVKGLASLCKESGIPLALLCGTLAITPQQAEGAGITYAASVLNRPTDLKTAQEEAAERVTEAAYYLTKLMQQSRRMPS